MTGFIHEEVILFVVGERVAHAHRLGGGGRLVEKRGVGQSHAGEVSHHGLEVQQRLQSSLRYLSLVRCVRSVPARILKNLQMAIIQLYKTIIQLDHVRFLESHRE